jgi:hypothetical protein
LVRPWSEQCCLRPLRFRSSGRHCHRRQSPTFWRLTKPRPALVIRAVQLALQESIGAIGVRHGAARQASPASGLLRPLLGAASFLSALPSPAASHRCLFDRLGYRTALDQQKTNFSSATTPPTLSRWIETPPSESQVSLRIRACTHTTVGQCPLYPRKRTLAVVYLILFGRIKTARDSVRVIARRSGSQLTSCATLSSTSRSTARFNSAST